MKFTKVAITALCSAMLFCACAKDNDIVLTINGKNITKKEYYEDFNRIKNAQLKNTPKEYRKDNGYTVIALKERYTNDVIVRTLLEQEFVKKGIVVKHADVEAKKKQVIDQVGSEEKFNTILKENNISEERLRKDLINEVKMDMLVDRITNVKISDAEAERFYKAHKAEFDVPARAQVSHILINTNPASVKKEIVDADKNAKLSSNNIDEKVKEEVAKNEALAKDLQSKLAKNPKLFAEYARKYSKDIESARNGGDLGYITKESMVKEFSDAAFSQKVGAVGPLVKTQFGTHIILVKDRAAKGSQSFASVKNDLKEYLSQQKKSQEVQKYIEGLKNSANIVYVDESLSPQSFQEQLQEIYEKQIKKAEKNQKTKEKKAAQKKEADKK